MPQIVEERLAISSGPLRLGGVLSYPERGTPEHAVLLCSPHPHFAGDMDNNVIQAIAQRLSNHSVVLRFDYRGVGQSDIALEAGVSVFDYWTQIEESGDYTQAVEDVAAAAETLTVAVGSLAEDLCVVGYSFGAAVGMMFGLTDGRVNKMVALAPPLGKVSFDFFSDCRKPSLHLVGKRDFLYSRERIEAYRQAVGPAARVVILDEADHFFRGDEDVLAQEVDGFMHEA